MGILANSASRTHASSTDDATSSGYVVNEKVVLTVDPVGTNYSWAISLPSSSSPVRAGLSGETGSSVTFKPDVGGIYTVVCNVDGTVYVLRLTVVDVVLMTPAEALRLVPVADASVPAPATGVLALYNSSDEEALVTKDSAGTVAPLGAGESGGVTESALRTAAAALTASFDVNGQQVTDLPAPSGATDAARKGYVDDGDAATLSAAATAAGVADGELETELLAVIANGDAATLASATAADVLLSSAAPAELSDSTPAAGDATTSARANHAHAHGNRGGGSMHAAASGSAAGFQSSAHYTRVERLAVLTLVPGTNLTDSNANVSWSSTEQLRIMPAGVQTSSRTFTPQALTSSKNDIGRSIWFWNQSASLDMVIALGTLGDWSVPAGEVFSIVWNGVEWEDSQRWVPA